MRNCAERFFDVEEHACRNFFFVKTIIYKLAKNDHRMISIMYLPETKLKLRKQFWLFKNKLYVRLYNALSTIFENTDSIEIGW